VRREGLQVKGCRGEPEKQKKGGNAFRNPVPILKIDGDFGRRRKKEKIAGGQPGRERSFLSDGEWERRPVKAVRAEKPTQRVSS